MVLLYFMLLVFGLNAEVVERRGFVVKDPEGKAYLCDLPSVKGCCLHKTSQKVLLVGDFGPLPEYSAVTLKGEFISDSEGDKLISQQMTSADRLP
jgi:hypothetical protein